MAVVLTCMIKDDGLGDGGRGGRREGVGLRASRKRLQPSVRHGEG